MKLTATKCSVVGLLIAGLAGSPAAIADTPAASNVDATADAAIPMGKEARKDDKKVVLNVFGMT